MEFLLCETSRGTLRFKKPIQLFDFTARKSENKLENSRLLSSNFLRIFFYIAGEMIELSWRIPRGVAVYFTNLAIEGAVHQKKRKMCIYIIG